MNKRVTKVPASGSFIANNHENEFLDFGSSLNTGLLAEHSVRPATEAHICDMAADFAAAKDRSKEVQYQ